MAADESYLFKPAPKNSPLRLWTEEQLLAKRRSPIVVIECLRLESGLPNLIHYLDRFHRSCAIPVTIPRGELLRWHRFWLNTSLAWVHLLDAVFPHGPGEARVAAVLKYSQISRRERRSAVSEEALLRWWSLQHVYYADEIREGRCAVMMEVERALSLAHWRMEPPDELPEFDRAVDTDPWPAWFWLKVALPSFFRYERSPSAILGSAMQGDLESLAQLVVLDCNAESIPGVAELLNSARRPKNSWKLESEIKKAQRYKSRGSISSFAKACGAATMIQWSKRICDLLPGLARPLDSGDTRKLFDAFAKVRRSRNLRDVEIPAGSEAYSKQVRRAFNLLKYVESDILSL